jgi:thymidylate synthase ThyX
LGKLDHEQHEGEVELHVVGLQLHDVAEAGEPGSRVVDGQTGRRGELVEAGLEDAWHAALGRQAALWERLVEDFPRQAQYAVGFAYKLRYTMQLNARAAMQMLELRTTPQGHPSYRRVCQAMHRLIAEEAGHAAVADMMRFVDHGAAELERLDAERASEARRQARA